MHGASSPSAHGATVISMTQFTSVNNGSSPQNTNTSSNATGDLPTADKLSGENPTNEPLLKTTEHAPSVNIVAFEEEEQNHDNLSLSVPRRSTCHVTSPVENSDSFRSKVKGKRSVSLAIPQVSKMHRR